MAVFVRSRRRINKHSNRIFHNSSKMWTIQKVLSQIHDTDLRASHLPSPPALLQVGGHVSKVTNLDATASEQSCITPKPPNQILASQFISRGVSLPSVKRCVKVLSLIGCDVRNTNVASALMQCKAIECSRLKTGFRVRFRRTSAAAGCSSTTLTTSPPTSPPRSPGGSCVKHWSTQVQTWAMGTLCPVFAKKIMGVL